MVDNRLIIVPYYATPLFQNSLSLLQRKIIHVFIEMGIDLAITRPKPGCKFLTSEATKDGRVCRADGRFVKKMRKRGTIEKIGYRDVEDFGINWLDPWGVKDKVQREDQVLYLDLNMKFKEDAGDIWRYANNGFFTTGKVLFFYAGWSVLLSEALMSRRKSMNIRPKLYLYVIWRPQDFNDRAIEEMHWDSPKYSNVVCNSLYTKGLFTEQYRKSMSIVSAKGLEKKITYIPLGIEIDQLKESKEKFETFTFLYGGRCEEYKGINEACAILEKLKLAGRKFRFVVFVTDEHDNAKALAKRYDFVECHYDRGREEFYEYASKSHAYLCLSTRETYGLSWYEMSYCGCVGIFWTQDWQSAVLHNHDYKLRIRDQNDIAKVTMYVMDNYEKAKKEFNDPLVEHLNQEHDAVKNMQRLGKVIQGEKNG